MKNLYEVRIGSLISTIREEGWTFIFICVYLFLEYVRPQSVYSALDILPWVPVVLTLTIFSLVLSGEFRAQPNVLNKLIICYAVAVLSSSCFSQYPSLSFSRWRTFFDWFIIYFLIVSIINNEKRFFIFLLTFLIYSMKMSQHGFLSWVMRGFAFANWGVVGGPGWFHNSGEVGIQMCIYVPLSIAFIVAIYPFLSWPKLLFFLAMPFTGVGTMVASSSRGALVGLGASSIRLFLLRPGLVLTSGLFLSLMVGIIFLSLPQESLQRFEASGKDSTSLHRLERWNHGIDALKKFPLSGVGFDVWPEYYPENYNIENPGSHLVHNVFVQCGSELGYPGLIVFLLMILACFSNTKNVRKLSLGAEDRFLATMSYGFDAALLGFLGSGFFVTVLYYPYFWIHCAMTVCLHTAAKEKFLPK
jgi:putative inorganic carbon (hco3(-)) transporter